MNFTAIKLGAAIAAATVVGSLGFSAPAQALTITANNLLSLEGSVKITRQTATTFDFDFLDNIKIADESDAPPYVIGDSVSIQDLIGLSEANNPFGPIDNFITGIATTSGDVNFNLTSLTFAETNNNRTFNLLFLGKFVGGSGEILGEGTIGASVAGGLPIGQNATRNLEGNIIAVPTPALVPAALGFAATMLRKRKEEEAGKETAEAKA